MDFAVSEQQSHLVEAARVYAAERIAPYYQQRDAEGAFDRATIEEMGRLGFFGIELPEEAGGLGRDSVTAGLVIEALSGDDYNLGYVPVTISLVSQILHRYGRPEVAAPWLKSMSAGETIPCVALTEPSGGSDAANLTLRARKVGSD